MTRDRGLEIECSELVELVTDYLEGALDDDRRITIDAHLRLCPHCELYLEQMRTTITTLGHVPVTEAQQLPDEIRSNLLSAFRAEHGG